MTVHNQVLQQQVWEFFCNDLDSCIEVSKDTQQNKSLSRFKGGLNFTAALTIFSVLEFISSFYLNSEPSSSTFAKFLSKYGSRYFDKFSNENLSKKLYEVFRNGLSHQWSPKGSGIAMDIEGDWLVSKQRSGEEEILALNIPTFYELAKLAIKDYEAEMDNNDALQQNFNKRYKKVVREDFMHMRILRDMLDNSGTSV